MRCDEVSKTKHLFPNFPHRLTLLIFNCQNKFSDSGEKAPAKLQSLDLKLFTLTRWPAASVSLLSSALFFKSWRIRWTNQKWELTDVPEHTDM